MKLKSAFLMTMTFVLVTLTGVQAQDEQKRHQKPDVDKRVERVTSELRKDLQLPEYSWTQVAEVYRVFYTEMDLLRGSAERRPDRAQVQKLRDDRDTKLKQILNEDEFAKLKEVEQSMKNNHGQRGKRKTGQVK